MSAIDNLEELDNKTLREKCMEYGLPNVPITDTSRKLLIKRLRTAMAGGDGTKATEKTKSRRETIHIIKVDKEADKKEETPKGTPAKSRPTASRRTIAAPLVRETEPEPPRASVTQRRRSNRTTPISELEPMAAFTSKRNFKDVIEESDEDFTPIPIPPIIEKSSEPARQTRAPSLSKSPVVTTSYVRDTPERSVRDEEEPDEQYDDDFDDDFEPEIQIIQEPIKNKYITSARSYDTTKPFSSLGNKEQFSSLGKREQFSLGTKESSFGLDTGRFGSTTSRLTLSKAPTSTFSLDSTATRRYTTGGYQAATTSSENKTFAHRTDYKENSEEESLEPQYLSDFARRLSRLKAEPISSPLKPEIDPQRAVPRYYTGSVTGRRNVGSLNESVGESFNKFLLALDKKYHLKKNFIIGAVILAIVLIYILFF